MSSGTQAELDWAAAQAPQNSGANSGAYPSDEEILGIEAPSPDGDKARQAFGGDAQGSAQRGESQQADANAGEQPSRDAQAESRDGEDLRAFRELFPGGASEARTLRQAAREAESLREAAQSVERIDTAIFSGDARAQAEVVAELAQANPAAFRQLFAEAEKVLAQMQGGEAHRPKSESQESGAEHNPDIVDEAQRLKSVPQEPQFDPAAYGSFERATNDAVARDVRATIADTLARVLPEGVAEGAARRIGEDIFSEIHRTLAADQALSGQIGAVLSGRRFGQSEQQRVAALLAGRARQVAPSVARRVIGEWTSSVLNTARTRAARQAAAAARVDIAAPGGSLDSMPLRPMSGREVDYARMSDDDILSL